MGGVLCAQVTQELKQVRGLVNGVPYFVLGKGEQEYHISGAQVTGLPDDHSSGLMRSISM